jgi:hypothetical protein
MPLTVIGTENNARERRCSRICHIISSFAGRDNKHPFPVGAGPCRRSARKNNPSENIHKPALPEQIAEGKAVFSGAGILSRNLQKRSSDLLPESYWGKRWVYLIREG